MTKNGSPFVWPEKKKSYQSTKKRRRQYLETSLATIFVVPSLFRAFARNILMFLLMYLLMYLLMCLLMYLLMYLKNLRYFICVFCASSCVLSCVRCDLVYPGFLVVAKCCCRYSFHFFFLVFFASPLFVWPEKKRATGVRKKGGNSFREPRSLPFSSFLLLSLEGLPEIFFGVSRIFLFALYFPVEKIHCSDTPPGPGGRFRRHLRKIARKSLKKPIRATLRARSKNGRTSGEQTCEPTPS